MKHQAVVKDMLDKLIDSHVAHGNQLTAMQTLAALISVEISSSKPDPEQYLLEASAQLTGLADMTARATKEGADILNTHLLRFRQRSSRSVS